MVPMAIEAKTPQMSNAQVIGMKYSGTLRIKQTKMAVKIRFRLSLRTISGGAGEAGNSVCRPPSVGNGHTEPGYQKTGAVSGGIEASTPNTAEKRSKTSLGSTLTKSLVLLGSQECCQVRYCFYAKCHGPRVTQQSIFNVILLLLAGRNNRHHELVELYKLGDLREAQSVAPSQPDTCVRCDRQDHRGRPAFEPSKDVHPACQCRSYLREGAYL
jgi:hypothetical protein